MRIEKEMKGQGYFWRPCTPDQQAPGTLSISDGGIIKLEIQEPLNGKFDNRSEDDIYWRTEIDDPQFIFQPKDFESENRENTQRVIEQIEQRRKIEQIIGRVSGLFEHTVILNNCHYERITGAIGRAKSLIHAEIAFTSIHLNKANFDKVNYSENKINDIKSVNFSIEGIDEWVGISGIKTHHKSLEEKYISYRRPISIPIKLNNDMELSIKFREIEKREGVPFIKEAGISQKTFFNLISQKPRKLEEFTTIIDKITTFLCFFTSQTVSLDYIAIGDIHKPINVFYQSQIHSKYKPSVERSSMLLDFTTMGDDTEILINNWIEAYKEYERAFDLYFSTKTRSQMPLEDKFLALARSLEIYYRSTSDDKQIEQARLKELIKLCKNQCENEEEKNFVERNLSSHNTLSLRRKIEKMIEPFEEIIGDTSNQAELAKQITKTRHDLTHEGTSPEKDLEKLYLKTESIFQLLLLQSVGFNQEQINNIVEWRPRLKRPFLDY